MGNGVFIEEDAEEGDLIESCPMIMMSWRHRYFGDPQIHRYLYQHTSCDCEECKRHGNRMYMVVGYAMIYNHQDDPNAVWAFDFNKLFGHLIATKPIKSGEEIFINYGKNYFQNAQVEKYTIQ